MSGDYTVFLRRSHVSSTGAVTQQYVSAYILSSDISLSASSCSFIQISDEHFAVLHLIKKS